MNPISPEKIRLLLVADKGSALASVPAQMVAAGFRDVEHSANLRMAEQQLTTLLGSGHRHAVILDSRLEDSSGAYAAGMLRRNQDLEDVALLVYVDDPGQISWRKIFEMGADEILGPAQSPEEVTARILHAIARRAELVETREREQDLAASNERLRVLASIDELTGLHNARYFNAALDSQWQWTLERKKPLSLLMLDIDMFKEVNDTFSHLAGNEVLEAVAGRIRHSIRQSTDLAARFGGEEFAIILPGAAAAQALRVAEGLREKIEHSPIKSHEAGVTVNITVSIGVISAQANLHPELKEAEDVLREADKALYEAKRDGRNCVRISEMSVGLAALQRSGKVPVKTEGKDVVKPLKDFLSTRQTASS